MAAEWKNNLLKLVAGGVLFIGLTAAVKFMAPSEAQFLVATIQSALTGIGVIHITNGDREDIANNVIKMIAGAGLIAIIGFLVYYGLASSSILIADIGAALVAMGIITSTGASKVAEPTTQSVPQVEANTQPIYIQNKSNE